MMLEYNALANRLNRDKLFTEKALNSSLSKSIIQRRFSDFKQTWFELQQIYDKWACTEDGIGNVNINIDRHLEIFESIEIRVDSYLHPFVIDNSIHDTISADVGRGSDYLEYKRELAFTNFRTTVNNLRVLLSSKSENNEKVHIAEAVKAAKGNLIDFMLAKT